MPTELDKHTEAPPDSLTLVRTSARQSNSHSTAAAINWNLLMKRPALDAVGDCKGMSNHVDLGVVEETTSTPS